MDECPPIKAFFTSRFEHALDDKGRVTLPVRYRKHFPDSTAYLVPAAHGEPCLRVYNMQSWNEYDAKYIEALNEFEAGRASDLIRDLYGSMDEVTVDKGGRIMLPDDVVTGLGLSGKVLLVGHRDHFEIWDPETFHVYQPVRDEEGV